MKPELIEALNFFQVTVQTFDPRTAHLQVELLVLLSSSLIICLCLDPWVLEEEKFFQPKVSSSILVLISSFLSSLALPLLLSHGSVPPPYKDARCPWLLQHTPASSASFVSLLACWFGHLFCSFVSFLACPVTCSVNQACALPGSVWPWLPSTSSWMGTWTVSSPSISLPGAVPWVAKVMVMTSSSELGKNQTNPSQGSGRWLKQGSQGNSFGLEFCSAEWRYTLTIFRTVITKWKYPILLETETQS